MKRLCNKSMDIRCFMTVWVFWFRFALFFNYFFLSSKLCKQHSGCRSRENSWWWGSCRCIVRAKDINNEARGWRFFKNFNNHHKSLDKSCVEVTYKANKYSSCSSGFNIITSLTNVLLLFNENPKSQMFPEFFTLCSGDFFSKLLVLIKLSIYHLQDFKW